MDLNELIHRLAICICVLGIILGLVVLGVCGYLKIMGYV